MGTSLEQVLADTEKAATGAAQASAGLVKASKALVRAAQEGDLVKLRRTLSALDAALQGARQSVSNATAAWSITESEEEDLLRHGYEVELLEEGRRSGLDIRRSDEQLLAFPSVLRILPSQRAVRVDKTVVRTIRPSRLVQMLRSNATKKAKLSPERFIETLLDAYRLVVGKDGFGSGTTLVAVYRALTVHPDMRKEYTLADFTRDVFVLDRSGVSTSKSGARLSLPAATGTKGSQVLQLVAPTGEPVSYYGIRFSL